MYMVEARSIWKRRIKGTEDERLRTKEAEIEEDMRVHEQVKGKAGRTELVAG